MKNSNNKVWLITGCSTGFGRAFATAALQAGYLVAVASRKISDIQDIVDSYPNNAFAVQLDVSNADEIKAAVRVTLDHFGKIDVLLNNAGIGYFGAIEESDDAEIRRMFEINFFGLANLIKEVLPHMRSQNSGHIINVASIGGLTSFPALGYYHATKYAVDGFSESLSKEIAHLGIKVTIIAPGAFRTDWAGRSANETPGKISDYTETAEATKVWLRNKDGNQPGNPLKAAEAVIKVVESPNPPLRLLLGHDAMEAARAKVVLLNKDFDEWESTSLNVNF
ncbi:oxidoreductase [Arcicella lustrica]|uniref:Oxidoreductase n=1 Tax=Arcicella lustrica TaxID=2984196 RepID=A0ABU5SQW6_9BACT|nr:oxidoreductase [Arcicella sp. DC25W]MEA5429709.1 oxidoreductase [Arcicella sp. DC25W]